MKKSKTLGFCLIVWAVCIALSACSKTTYELPLDTSAIEEYIETTSAGIAENTVEETTAETIPAEPLSDFDKAISLAQQIVFDSKWSEFMLYDMDFDGIPELLEETGFIYTKGWEVYKLTGNEPLNIGCIEFVPNNDYYIKKYISIDAGLHIYCDAENGKIFYIAENPYEMHADGFCEGIRYDVYSDTISEEIIYTCKWYNCIDEQGNKKYIYFNTVDGQQASAKYSVDIDTDGFRFCSEFKEYLSQYEYLGIIDDTNTFDTESGGDFFEYAEQFRNLPKLKDEQVYVDKTEYVTVCGTEYDINSYSAEIEITEENFDSIDFTELKKLPKLELLTIDNLTDKEIDIAPLNGLEKLKWLDIRGGYNEEQLKDFDSLEFLNVDVSLEILPEMNSLKCIDVGCADNLSILYNMKQLETVKYCYLQRQNGEIGALAEKRPDLLLIYVP